MGILIISDRKLTLYRQNVHLSNCKICNGITNQVCQYLLWECGCDRDVKLYDFLLSRIKLTSYFFVHFEVTSKRGYVTSFSEYMVRLNFYNLFFEKIDAAGKKFNAKLNYAFKIVSRCNCKSRTVSARRWMQSQDRRLILPAILWRPTTRLSVLVRQFECEVCVLIIVKILQVKLP